MSDQPATILIRVRDRIADPERWTSRSPARDAAGQSVPPRSQEATSWCLIGAVLMEGGRCGGPEFIHLKRAALPSVVSIVNDRGHAHALALCDAAIALAEAAS